VRCPHSYGAHLHNAFLKTTNRTILLSYGYAISACHVKRRATQQGGKLNQCAIDINHCVTFHALL
jgi:hypothetical protein